VADHDRRRSLRERGSALVLMPTAVLILVVLAALAVDQSLVFMRQRELVVAAQAAANDAAGYGVDKDEFYSADRVAFDLGRARAAATAAVQARGIVADVEVTISADRREVVVVLRSSVPGLFARAVPGAGHRVAVAARGHATIVVG